MSATSREINPETCPGEWTYVDIPLCSMADSNRSQQDSPTSEDFRTLIKIRLSSGEVEIKEWKYEMLVRSWYFIIRTSPRWRSTSSQRLHGPCLSHLHGCPSSRSFRLTLTSDKHCAHTFCQFHVSGHPRRNTNYSSVPAISCTTFYQHHVVLTWQSSASIHPAAALI